MIRNAKIGRNAPCPCGSGKKYKECCLPNNRNAKPVPVLPTEISRFIDEQRREALARERIYGHVRPVISANHAGGKFVAVGNELCFGKTWKTFPDFLIDYLGGKLGHDWGTEEIKKPYGDRHQIVKWYDAIGRFIRLQAKGENGLYSAVPNGPFAAFLLLAYDLYILKHNSALQTLLINRLKNKNEFQGARYELFVAATFCRAGFDIEYEDESDRSKTHPEFVAIHKQTGQKISVEAKSRHRPGVLDFCEGKVTGDVRADVGQLLTRAFRKAAPYPYVIFVDLNLPPPPDDSDVQPWWFDEVRSTIKRAGNKLKDRDQFFLIIFTNHPHHYGDEGKPDPKKDYMMVFSERPNVPVDHPISISDIIQATMQYGNIPNTFE